LKAELTVMPCWMSLEYVSNVVSQLSSLHTYGNRFGNALFVT
jgi:hypothetical protein